MKTRIELDILPQPDDTTCGPTCLHAVYRYYGESVDLDQVIQEVGMLAEGGTLAVQLACHALRRGFSATIYTYNLTVFDPTWFRLRDRSELERKLRAQKEAKPHPKLVWATDAYLEFLALGGKLRHQELSSRMIRELLRRAPVLTGLSATYLYDCAREIGETNQYDDVLGEPAGHFVVLVGYDRESRRIEVADPLGDNPAFEPHRYEVSIDRLLGAILLGVLTYDANLLVIEQRAGRPAQDKNT